MWQCGNHSASLAFYPAFTQSCSETLLLTDCSPSHTHTDTHTTCRHRTHIVKVHTSNHIEFLWVLTAQTQTHAHKAHTQKKSAVGATFIKLGLCGTGRQSQSYIQRKTTIQIYSQLPMVTNINTIMIPCFVSEWHNHKLNELQSRSQTFPSQSSLINKNNF